MGKAYDDIDDENDENDDLMHFVYINIIFRLLDY